MQQPFSAYFKAMKILFTALFTGQVFFAVIAYVLQKSGSFSGSPSLLQVFMYAAPAFNIMGIIVAHLIFKRRAAAIDIQQPLRMKLDEYRALCILRWAIIEGPTIFTIIAFLLTGAQVFLALTVFMLLVFLSLLPSRERLKKELALSSEEANIIDDPNGIIN